MKLTDDTDVAELLDQMLDPKSKVKFNVTKDLAAGVLGELWFLRGQLLIRGAQGTKDLLRLHVINQQKAGSTISSPLV